MRFSTPLVAGLMAVSPATAAPKPSHGDKELYKNIKPIKQLELGPRPYYLVNDMDEGSLKKKLQSCSEKPQKPSLWSIAHRGGATLQFPEHSLENNLAGARMGAGVLECDVAFTKDRELVCRHSQCDLHYTTNIVTIPELNKKCTQPFKAAKDGKPASAKCCTSDITLKEYKTLCAKMEGFNATATNAADFLKGTPGWRTDLYSTCGTVMTNKEHIQLTKRLGLKHTPELKTPEVKMPFDGDYTQEKYAQQLIDEHKEAGVKASDVYLQSFLYDDILYWLEAEPEYARQAMYLDETGDSAETFPAAVANLTRYAKDGVKYIAPPLPYLVQPGKGGKIVPSPYAKKAKELGLKIVTWSLERSPPLKQAAATGDYYYSTIAKIVNNDGDVFKLLDVFREIGVVGVFSDWSATVTYYANCFGIGL